MNDRTDEKEKVKLRISLVPEAEKLVMALFITQNLVISLA